MKINDPNNYSKIKIKPGKYYLLGGMFLPTTIWDFVCDHGEFLSFKVKYDGGYNETRIPKQLYLKNRWLKRVKFCNKCVYESK